MSSDNCRYFTVLPDIELKNLDGTPAKNQETGAIAKEGHVKFIRERCADPAFVTETPKDPNTVHWTMPMLVSAAKIIGIVENLEPGDEVKLQDEDWQRLKRATEKGVTYAPIGAMACIPFMREITGATMESREARKKKEKKTEDREADAPEEEKTAT